MSGKDWAVAVAVGLCALGLLACGGGGGSGSGGGGDEAASEEGRLKMAECLRKHGLDVPDPVAGANGIAIQKTSKGSGKGFDPEDPATQKAIESCEDEVGFEPPEVSPEQEEELKEDMLAFAQCMRGHGVDMPDPEFGEGGKVKMRIGGPGGPGKMDQPAVEAAQEACQDKMPGDGKGGFGFKAGP